VKAPLAAAFDLHAAAVLNAKRSRGIVAATEAGRGGRMGIREDLLKLAAEIGPRGACTLAERRAGDYVRARFEGRGLNTETQEFSCIDTYSYLYIVYLAVAAACGYLSRWFPYYVAPVAVAFAILFAFDLETFPLVSRLLPRKRSRNVIARSGGEDEKVSLVVVAHYDSARAALSFHPRLVGNFRLSFSMMIGGIFLAAALTLANLVIKAASGGTNPGVWIAAVVVSTYLLFPLAIMLHREIAMDYTPGANDNASGVATMLAVMDKISEEESGMPGVMFVATGAEEVGTAGMIEFLKRYGGEVRDALIVNLDNLGTGHLCYIDREGMLLPHRSSPVLLWLSDRVAAAKSFPVWRTGYRLLSTDATPALARGYKAMSVMAFDDQGRLPNWHWENDTVDMIEIENLETARGLLWNLARRILA